jgi:ribosome maturation protein SDO1
MKNDIANIVVEKTFNTETGLPFPQAMILQVLDDINFKIQEKEDTKKQALKAIKVIMEKDILPIERKYMQVLITLRSNKLNESAFDEFKDQLLTFLKEINAKIVEDNLDNFKNFAIKCNIQPQNYREMLTKFEEGKL